MQKQNKSLKLWNQPVLDFIALENLKRSKKSISTFDFSTLYTSIPHNQLIDNLTKFVEWVFDFKNKQFILPNLYTSKAYFSDQRAKTISFNKFELIECLKFLVDNSYVYFNGCVYKQIVGIPMGTNSGPQIANIYLFIYEYDYIKALIL